MKEEIFKSYDIRGVYEKDFDKDDVILFAKAFYLKFKPKKIVIGKDMRTSSEEIHTTLIQTFLSLSVDIVDISLSSTPLFYFSLIKETEKYLKEDKQNSEKDIYGIIITASHNPKQYNGFKICRAYAKAMNYDTGIKDIKDICFDKDKLDKLKLLDENKNTKLIKQNYLTQYSLELKEFKEFKTQKKKILIDCANAIAAYSVKKVFENLNITADFLYDTLNGSFPNHEANPLKTENLRELGEKVILGNYDLGISFDGDADRIGVVNEKGKQIKNDYLICLFTEYFLKKGKKNIGYDLRSSKIIEEIILKNNANPYVTRVGHSYIKDFMKEKKIDFSGELSGHFYFGDFYVLDVGVLSALILINILEILEIPISEKIKTYKKYVKSDEINFEIDSFDKITEIFKDIKTYYLNRGTEIKEIDGLSVYSDSYWFNIRKSNTEPVIRINFEADTKDILDKNLEKLKKLIYE